MEVRSETEYVVTERLPFRGRPPAMYRKWRLNGNQRNHNRKSQGKDYDKTDYDFGTELVLGCEIEPDGWRKTKDDESDEHQVQPGITGSIEDSADGVDIEERKSQYDQSNQKKESYR